MGMALCRRAVLAASFRRPSAIPTVAPRLSSPARLAPTARVGIVLPFPRRVPSSSYRAALVCSPTAPPSRHLQIPSTARSFRASLCAPRALAGTGESDRQLLASARSGDRGARLGALRGVAIGAGNGTGGGSGDAQLRSAEEEEVAEVVRANVSGGAEGEKEGRGKARAGKKSISSYGAEHIQVYEVVDNAIDEARAGHASTVHMLLGADGSVCVTDNGRGVSAHALRAGLMVQGWLADGIQGGLGQGNGYSHQATPCVCAARVAGMSMCESRV
ncbi:unnamed protein product [Closterium sp. Naga37s-1]|nr:unnamed protein product [Closterium sp. Naga37s-1]